ncbi:carbohydrate ABC transporter permease [Cryobacterium sp.]|jgi:multiple sugar transport system permease protein|uniref:carbohydrate ABC transporter permease n=1 Tax=Cryobacterium sp. TaxID=1926290 RepID=UPI002611CF94|nr:sugar ABC transporter permease [Cryobacterium sp.]MCU1445489.1 transporter permease [Cryobacterium sp.]
MTHSPALTHERPASPPLPKRRTSPTKRKQRLAAYLFLLPFFVVFLTMLVVPLVYAGYLSLFQSKLIGGDVFAGLANYVRALTDSAFLGSLGRVGLFFIIQVPIMLGLALFLALALDSARARGSKAVRLLIFMPYAVPAVVATLMWGYLYGPDFGPIGQVARAVGLGTPDFLSAQSVLGSMMNIVTWEFVGYNMIIMYAALRSIPAELYEAAEIDGAGQFRLAWSIKIPAIRPAIMLTVIFSVIGSFQLFAEPSLLNSIAPAAITPAFTPNYYAYNLAFINQELNYAAAIAFLLGLVIAVVSYFVQLAGERRERVPLTEKGAES